MGNISSCCKEPEAQLMEHDECDVEHDPDNFKDISEFTEEEFQAIGWASQGSAAGAVGTNTGSRGDDRNPVDLDQNPLPASIARTCFILMGNGMQNARGSGIILDWTINGKNIKFVMTCAHCLADSDRAKSGQISTYSNITCYQMYRGQYDYGVKYQVVRAVVHPAWRGSPSNGFDYGIGILGEGQERNGLPEIHDDYFVSVVGSQGQYSMTNKMGRVIGFPGSWGDTMTEMNGQFRDTRTRRVGQYTGVAVYYDIDQTGGNSGGPVFTIDSSFVNQLKGETTQNLDADDDKCLMGIVTGAGYGDNVGTLLTPELMQWTVAKLGGNAEYAGKPYGNQDSGNRYGNGHDFKPYRPNKPTRPSVGGLQLTDFVSFNMTQTFGQGAPVIDGILRDGRTIRLTSEQFEALTGQPSDPHAYMGLRSNNSSFWDT